MQQPKGTERVGHPPNRLSKADQLAGVTSNFSYDPLYQLTGVTQGPTTTESYTYDAVGNRLSSLGMSPYQYNSSNELTSTPTATYTYDKNGELKTKVDSTGTTTYNWDTTYRNLLTSIVLPGTGGTVSFRYDPFGRRIQKSGPAGTTNYLYDGPNPLEEVDQNGNVLGRYAQGPGIDEPLSMVRAGTTSYYEADALGSVTSLSNSSGALANTYAYDSYGKQTGSTGTIVNPLQFTGREFDLETSIYEYRARYYDPNIGRFISEDPIGFAGGQADLYAYVYDSPTNMIDPIGLAGIAGRNCGKNPCDRAGGAPDPSVYEAKGQDAQTNAIKDLYYLFQFRAGGGLDAQPQGASPAYANYVYGAYMSAAGYTLNQALAGADTYAQYRSSYRSGTTMDPNYQFMPEVNVMNIIYGFDAQQNGTLCHK